MVAELATFSAEVDDLVRRELREIEEVDLLLTRNTSQQQH